MTIKKRIAIIGSGISGLSMAYFLKDKHHITLYEKNDRLGGHSRTISLQNNNHQKIDVDTGFIVLNDRTYPNLNALFSFLKIQLVKTEMSFSFSGNNGELEWSSKLIDSFFAQRKNILNFSMLKGAFDIYKFNKKAVQLVKDFPKLTIQELIDKLKLGAWFKNYYLIPISSAIWSCSYEQIIEFPASSFINFFQNHGLLSFKNKLQWYTLKNKSIDYVKALEALINQDATIIKNASLFSITRAPEGVEIKQRNSNQTDHFDEVVFACHPTEILKILKDPSPQESSCLSKFSSQKNIVYLHNDVHQMPKLKKCWSSWNYIYEKNSVKNKASVTYYMNKLQHIPEDFIVLVTLNPISPIPKNKTFDIYEFEHPVFNYASIEGIKEIDTIQGAHKVWFCGAYLRYGFHEDGIWSTMNILKKII